MTSGILQNKIKYLFLIFIILSGIILYLPSIAVEFLSDEIAFISRNEPEDITSLLTLFDKKDYDGDYYRPMGNFLSGVLTLSGGYDTRFYRVFNLLLNTANGVLVFFFLLLLLKGREKGGLISFFGALFFVSFPLNDYAVIWHTDLFDRLMMFFYFLSLIFYLKGGRYKTLSLLFFLLAALSKEMAFSLPLVILALSYLIRRDQKLTFSVKESLPYFAMLLMLLLFRWIVFDNNILNLQDAHSESTITGSIKNFILFWGMLIFPFFLREIQEIAMAYPVPIIITVMLTVPPLLYYLFKARRTDLLLFFLIIFITITLIPASRLLMRWYLYLPSAGFAALLSYLILGSNIRLRTALITAVSVFTFYYAYTLYRQTVWIDISVKGKSSVTRLINDYRDEINQADKLTFLTLPAKVKDIPLFQLGFDHHLKYYLGNGKDISLITRSYLENFEAKSLLSVSRDTISISHTGDNYFILSGNEKNIKFISEESVNKPQSVVIAKEKEPKEIIFTFSEGTFHLIKE
jgi:hypothetical protein